MKNPAPNSTQIHGLNRGLANRKKNAAGKRNNIKYSSRLKIIGRSFVRSLRGSYKLREPKMGKLPRFDLAKPYPEF
jgi:hypothetical protein